MRFARYMGYRLVTALPVILGIIVLNFLLIHLAPGDAASVLAGESGAATPEYMDALRHKFGLDQSLGMQFLTYVSNMAHFNLGYSYRNDADVSSLILERLGPTSLLMLTAFGTAVGARHHPRSRCRDRAQFLARQYHFADQPRRLCDARILAWADDDRDLFDRPRLAADQRVRYGRRRSRGVGRGLGHRSPSRDARRLARAVLPRALCAPHASVRLGANRHGLRDDGARQGPDRAPHHDRSCPAQCAVA